VQIGYRQDNFKLTTKNHQNDPLIITKQDWKNVQSWTLGINGETCTEYNVFIKGKVTYGWVYKSDFSWETPLINSNLFHPKAGPHGRNYDANIAVGFPFWWNWCENCCDTIRFVPLVGFSWNRMNFKSRGRFSGEDISSDSSSDVLKTKA